MQCSICKDEVKEFDSPRDAHIVIHKSNAGHVHIHGELNDKELVKDMLDVAANEVGVEIGKNECVVPKEVVFHNRQRIGDMLMFTCAVRDFKAAFPQTRVNVISIAGHIWDHNPNIDRTLVPTNENTIKIGPGRLTNSSNRLDWHFANAYRVSIEDALKIHIPQGESRPDIYFTQEEYDAPRLFDFPYWIICLTGEKGWGCKMYPFKDWQEFVNINPDVMFVQIGTKEDNPPRLQGANVIDHVGKTQSKETGIRDLFKLFLNAEGSIGLVSFHMHLSGALYKPAIVVAGAREPVHFTRYEGHRYLSTDGALKCAERTACWHCDINACKNLIEREDKTPACVDMITPRDLKDALLMYYKGGRLHKGKVSPKPKLKNIVAKPKDVVIPVIKKPEQVAYGMKFGGGSLTDRDWEFIKQTVAYYKVKRVLEFGAGLSTLLLADLLGAENVVSLEMHEGWVKRIKKIKPECRVGVWNNEYFTPQEKYDLAFVDGPSGGATREQSTRIAAENANVVIVHDANREHERMWQDKYLKQSFKGPIKGGHRCHLWIRKDDSAQDNVGVVKNDVVETTTASNTPLQIRKINCAAKTIKVISTARGWGGCARSVTTIMRMLLAEGHKVEFIPFRNSVSSREFQEELAGSLKDVKVSTSYDTISEHCDVVFMYGDDYIWEFGKPDLCDIFSNINADKKIMVLNYRRGDVGTIPWTRDWDLYMFLNSTQEKELLRVNPGVKTRVLPPCTDLTEFFKVTPDYKEGIRIVRHSSQGDTKFAKDFKNEVDSILSVRPDVAMSMMPGPSFVPDMDRFRKISRNATSIPSFLATGNLFWYSLPRGYMDMGPRVILEAMAVGLPVLADAWGGALDRVTPQVGWVVKEKEEFAKIIESVTTDELQKKGLEARDRAFNDFRAENWIKEIVS